VLGIFAVGFADGVLTARAFAGRRNQRINVNQELLAHGVSNLAAGFTQGFPVGASNSRTAVNDQMGGKTQVAIAVITTVMVVLVGVLDSLVVAIVLSIVDVIARGSRPNDAVLGWVPRIGRYADVSLHRSARVTNGVVVYRLDDRLFFANAGYFKARAREALAGAPTPTRWLVFDAIGGQGVRNA